jgi:hypothetical protein
MLWPQFSAIFDNFRQKIGVFFSKTNVMIKFLHNLASFWVKKRQFLCRFFRRNYLKIIKSDPGHPGGVHICRCIRSNILRPCEKALFQSVMLLTARVNSRTLQLSILIFTNPLLHRVARWLQTKIWVDLGRGTENVGIVSGQLEHFTAIWYILWTFMVIWYIYFPYFGIL